uniref:Ig-like domain-containing protein n=1 Tax=Sinocyclocheilus grahami TaxID=75366 RepID=A0A672QM03_SINGR
NENVTFQYVLFVKFCVVCSPVIQQSPKYLRTVEEKEAKLFCRHGDNNYQYMYWYQQKSNGAMALIVLSYGATGDPNYEDGFKDRFKLERTETLNGVLKIPDLSQSDSGVYYCAVSMHSAVVFIACMTKNQTTRQTGNTHTHTHNKSNFIF